MDDLLSPSQPQVSFANTDTCFVGALFTETGVCTVDGGPKAFALMSAANGCTKADGRSLTLMHRDEEPGSLDSHIGAKGWGGSREVAGAASAIANMSSADLLPSSSHGVRSAVSTSKGKCMACAFQQAYADSYQTVHQDADADETLRFAWLQQALT